MDHHNKSCHKIYSVVPQIASVILNKYPEVAGFVIGGSYAKGKFSSGDDIDTDVIYESYPDTWARKLEIDKEIRQEFMRYGIELYIRLSLQTDTIPLKDRLETYNEHPNSPYIVRNRNVARTWGLIK